MMGHNIRFEGVVWKMILLTHSYLEHCYQVFQEPIKSSVLSFFLPERCEEIMRFLGPVFFFFFFSNICKLCMARPTDVYTVLLKVYRYISMFMLLFFFKERQVWGLPVCFSRHQKQVYPKRKEFAPRQQLLVFWRQKENITGLLPPQSVPCYLI